MAEFGAKYPCFKRVDADHGIVLGKLVAANLTVNLASGELYADDALDEQLSEFASGSLAMETNDLTDDNAAELYGCDVTDGNVTYNVGDTAPSGALAYYKSLMRNKAKYYKVIYHPSVRAALGNDNAQTKGSSITFATTATTFTVMADDNGDWRKTKTFDNEAAARAYIDNLCGIAKSYPVNIYAQGVGDGKSVSPLGIKYVAAGENLEITIEGYSGIVAAYDNGEDVTATIKGESGTYTLSAVSKPHDIVIIF